MHAEGFWGHCTLLIWLRWRLWPFVLGFFYTEFLDKKSEEHYSKENWFLRKSLAIWSACFYILNWTLAVIVTPRPTVLPDTIFYYGLTPVFTFPLVLMVMFDFPRDRQMIYQIFLGLSTWGWGIYQVIFIHICNFYHQGEPALYSCQGKDFLSTFYYTTALQTIALFGLQMHRFSGLVGMITFAVVGGVLVIPDRRQFTRYIVNFIVFQLFLLYVHYMRENAERRLYTLRDQLKIQFRATQKAQVNERKAADSKRRLTSYVFHEVRVPLNTALLAVQNMDASGTVAKAQEIEFKALEGSLSMMSKVLNDVLDFNRMDSGRFESVLRPYAFHKVMRSLFVPLQLATDARGLTFVTDLDKSIDDVARRALYEAMGGLTEDEIDKRMALDEDGIVVGDETRLRQIITNLASNACKFTPHGGSLTVKTRLVLPIRPVRSESSSVRATIKVPLTPGTLNTAITLTETPKSEFDQSQLSTARLDQHNSIHNKAPPTDCIVVRIEVTDTGCGIRQKDMVQSKLFSAFNQTEMGRQQGGKGTGLGLALVRQIVKLSGGRLGVQSKVNEGSTFWVEIPLGVGVKAVPGLVAVQTPDGSQDASDMSFSELINSPFAPSKDDGPPSQMLNTGTRTSSALHSIMEQGGLVEISAKRNDDSLVLTRTIGDPLTGTDAFLQSVNEEASPTSANQELPNFTLQNCDGVRPNYLKLPAPQDFSLHQIDAPSKDSPSSTTVVAHTTGNSSPPTSPGHEPTEMSQAIPETMKAQVVQADKTIRIEDKPVPTVGDDEVLVRVIAVAQNPTDWKHVEYLNKPGTICGCELAGEIVQVGKNVTRFSLGDIVTGINHGSTYPDRGAFAEYAILFEDLSWKVPASLKTEDAVTMNVGPLTTVQSFYHPENLGIPTPPAKVDGEQWILIYGGSSSVGLYAIQLAKISGFKVVTTASPRNFDLLISLGADAVFDYRDPEVIDTVKNATNDSIHLALDTISSPDSETLTIKTFAPGPGKLHLMMPPQSDAIRKLREDITISSSLLYTATGSAFKIADWDIPARPQDRQQVRDWLAGPWIQLVEDGLVKPNPVKLMPGGLEGIPEGFEYMKAGKNSAEKLVYRI